MNKKLDEIVESTLEWLLFMGIMVGISYVVTAFRGLGDENRSSIMPQLHVLVPNDPSPAVRHRQIDWG